MSINNINNYIKFKILKYKHFKFINDVNNYIKFKVFKYKYFKLINNNL